MHKYSNARVAASHIEYLRMNKQLVRTYHVIISYLLPVFALLLVLLFYLRTYDSCQIKITLLHIFGTLIIMFWIARLIEQGGLRPTREQWLAIIPVLTLFAVDMISYWFFSSYQRIAYDEILRRILYTGLFLVVFFEFSNHQDLNKFVWFVVIAAFLAGLYGFIQAAGVDPFIWKGAFSKRVFSTFGNPCFYGAFMAFVAPIVAVLFLKTRNWIYVIILGILAANVFMSMSKGPMLSIASGLVTVILLASRFLFPGQEKLRKYLKIGGITFVVVTVIAVGYYLSKNINSFRFRVFTYLSTVEMVDAHPWIGTGVGSFKAVYPQYRRHQIFIIEGKHNTETDHAHNEYLEVMYETGIIGFTIYLWAIFSILFAGYRRLSEPIIITKTRGPTQTPVQVYYLIAFISGFIAFMVENITDVHHRFVSSGTFFYLYLGIIGGLATHFSNSEVYPEKPVVKALPEGVRFALQLLTFGVGLWLAFGYFPRFFKADMHHNIAIAFSKTGRWNDALYHYDLVNKYNPHFAMAYYFRGNVFNDRWDMELRERPEWGDKSGEQRTDFERALAGYDELRSFAPNYVQSHYQIGSLYAKAAQDQNILKRYDQRELWEKAIWNFKRYIDLDPVFPYTYFRLGWCYIQTRQNDKAKEIFLEATRWPREPAAAWTNLGNTYVLDKEYKNAEWAYRKATQVNPEDENAWRALTTFYNNQNRPDEAQDAWMKVLHLQQK